MPAPLPETLTLDQARETLQALGESLVGETADEVVIDASPLVTFDSSALAVLLECRRLAQAGGKGFVVRGVPAPLAELAGLYGVDDLLALQTTQTTGAA